MKFVARHQNQQNQNDNGKDGNDMKQRQKVAYLSCAQEQESQLRIRR